MPIDVVTYKDGTKEVHYMALRMMRGEKEAETDDKRIVHEDWAWTNLFISCPLTSQFLRLYLLKSILQGEWQT